MFGSASDACAALAKGWRKRGLSKDKIASATKKCLRNWRAPSKRRHRAKKK